MPDVIPISDAVGVTQLEPGDIIAFYGDDVRSRAISYVTGFGPSHVGIVAQWELTDARGVIRRELVLVESTMLCKHPCLVAGELVAGVQVQCPTLRIDDYQGRVEIVRLSKHRKLLGDEVQKLTDHLHSWLGTPYDFRGALWSGTRILKYLPWLPHNDLGSVFCSELIATALQRLSLLCVWNAGLFNPASLVNTLVRSGVYLPGVPYVSSTDNAA